MVFLMSSGILAIALANLSNSLRRKTSSPGAFGMACWFGFFLVLGFSKTNVENHFTNLCRRAGKLQFGLSIWQGTFLDRRWRLTRGLCFFTPNDRYLFQRNQKKHRNQ